METFHIGIDLGYRFTDSVSQRETLTVPSVTDRFFPHSNTSNGLRPGVLVSPSEGMAGNTAIKQGAKPSAKTRANKNFTDGNRTTLSFHTKTLLFHAIRTHIPQGAESADVYLCLAVPRAEYDIAVDKETGERYSPLERAFADILERDWLVQNDGGKVCRVTIKKVLVKPQPELALWAQILRYDKHLDRFFHYDNSWMYKGDPEEKRFRTQQDGVDQLSQAVSTVVFDIGGGTSHAERQTVIDKNLTAVSSKSADIGMWTMLDEVGYVVQKATGENHLKPHQLMKIFETGRYGSLSLVPEFQQILAQHWADYDELFQSSFSAWEEVDRVLCVGRGWKKFDDLFRQKYQPLALEHNFDITFANGTSIADGAFKSIRAWYEKNK